MGSVDSMPIVIKNESAFQTIISADPQAVKKKQEGFIDGCPVVSKKLSVIHKIEGVTKGVRVAEEKLNKGIGHFTSGIGTVGHIKGAIEYVAGNA